MRARTRENEVGAAGSAAVAGVGTANRARANLAIANWRKTDFEGKTTERLIHSSLSKCIIEYMYGVIMTDASHNLVIYDVVRNIKF